ncbi:MAG: OB-fold nucleic acid binding domain-containing protein, partial [candidate division WOR-3 bacterium]
KKPDEMAAQRQDFVEGCVKHAHITRDRAERIFDLLEKFAGYGFNKSHAAGYAYLSFFTACLKANYPREFIAATLTSELGDSKKLAKFVSEARRMGIRVLGPDVNRSAPAFTIEGDAVRFGLAGVKGVGMGASEVVVAEREAHGPYKDLLDFLKRSRGSKVNRKAVEALIKAGALDSFSANRSLLLNRLDAEMAKATSDRLLFRERQADLFAVAEGPEPEPDFDTHTLLTYEKEAFGFYFSSHPLEPFRAEYEAFQPTSIAQLEGLKDGTKVVLGGVITSRRTRKSKSGREYIIVTVEDFEAGIEVMVFSEQLERARSLLLADALVAIQGTVKVRQAEVEVGSGQGVPQIWADRVYDLRNCCQWFSTLFVVLPEPEATKDVLLRVKEIVARHPGEKPVFLELLKTGDKPRRVQLREVRVDISNRLLEELRQVLGPDRLRLVAELPQPENGPARNRFRRPDRPNRY